MTLERWLRAREAGTPTALFERIRELAAPVAETGGDVVSQCLHAAEEGLRRHLRGDSGRRDAALDLLAIDALVTYALEACTEQPERVPQMAHIGMVRLGGLVPAVSAP